LLGTLRTILGWLDSRLRLRWALLVPVMCVAALVEAVGAVAVFGLLRMVVEPHRVRTTPVVSQIWQAWPSDNPAAVVALLTGLVAAFYVLRALLLVWAEWLKEGTVASSAARAAERLFSQYLAAEYLFHLKRRSASLIQAVTRATHVAFQLVVGSVINILAETATIAALIAVLALTAPPQVLGIVALVIAIFAVPVVASRRLWLRFGERQKALEEQQLHTLQQSLGAIKEVKIAGRESFFESRLRAARRALAAVNQRRAWIATALRLGVETVLIVSMLGVVLLVTLRGGSGGDTVSLLALFAYAGFRVVPSANRIMLNTGLLREGQAFITDALADFHALRVPAARAHGPELGVDFAESLVCDNVGFSYDADGPPALTSVNLRIKPGESIGIVGPTGAGKSTLVDVLLGLLRPTTGRVLLDGEDLAGRERAWQRLVGYVPQDPYVLDDTVRRNIAFGVPDTQIDEQRLARACSLAQLDDVVRLLPEGLDTWLGEKGTRLSGGQRQRVAIARALYSEPAVLVFDEATAALDNQTEREVTRAIATLHGTRTLIVIAHRLSTVQGCDRLLFLQDGRVAVTGAYNDLLRDPAFRAMAHP
jgi:ABC-type multidrug transport system fused ATPase/permease subunit